MDTAYSTFLVRKLLQTKEKWESEHFSIWEKHEKTNPLLLMLHFRATQRAFNHASAQFTGSNGDMKLKLS
jgi:hypothetical protein